jgi:hypothetical protein
VPLPKFVTQTLAPSNATPLTGTFPTGKVCKRGPVPSRLTRIRVTELLPEFATQTWAPSNPMPLGKVPTVNVFRVGRR